MMTRRKRNTCEREGLDLLINRLLSNNRYYSIDRNLHYDVRGLQGEFDVLGVRHNGTHVYFEYKCHHSSKKYSGVCKQFRRAKKAFPQYDWRFVYVTPQKIKLVTI